MLKGVHHQLKIAPKRRKFQEIKEKGGEDRISTLTDCLLVEILSRLPCTKQAIRTGTLSKRWKHLWTLVPTLIFAHQEENGTLSRDRRYPKWRPGFFSFVDKTLTQCRQLKLKKFVLYTSYSIEFESQVNNWVRFAISRDVEVLNLEFWYRGEEAVYLLDQSIFISSCFTDLRLESCKLNPTGTISWKNLRSLCIFYGELDEDLIQNILAGSPLLETLELEDCYGYSRLDITSKSVKNLVYSGYWDFHSLGNESIKINAPNILSLKINDDLKWRRRKLLFVNVSSLVEASIDFTKFWHIERPAIVGEDEVLKKIILNLPHVKELKIGPYFSKVLSCLEAKGFDFPSNVKFPVESYWPERKYEYESESESESENENENESEGESDGNSVESRNW